MGGTHLDGTSAKGAGLVMLLGLLVVVFRPQRPLVIAIELGMMVFIGLCEIGELEPLCDEISKIFA